MDWETFLINAVWSLIGGTITFTFGMYIFNKYYLPKLTAKMFADGVKSLSKDLEFKIYIDKAKDIITRLEPVVKQLKNVDIDKIQKDLRPFMAMVRQIDPDEVNALLKDLRGLTGTVQKAIEKPKIPKPTD